MNNSKQPPTSQSSRLRPYLFALLVLLGLGLVPVYMQGCFKKQTRDRSEKFAQQIEERKTKTDSLRKAMRFLAQMTPVTRDNYIKEIQLELNTWLKGVDTSTAEYTPPQLLSDIPSEMLSAVDCASPLSLRFGYWDIDFLYERRLMSKLAGWVTGFPLRDSLIAPMVENHKQSLSPDDGLKLEEACKLFDWTIRNVLLDSQGASVEELHRNPTDPSSADGLGYGYLPWESLLFSTGDYVERGRVFTALAEQRGIDTFWISTGASDAQPGNLWAVGVALSDAIYLFEPKLGLPILHPDAPRLATLTEAIENDRILRRLDLPGQFDYALERDELQPLKFLIDAQPVAASARMKLLEAALLGDERMQVYRDIEALKKQLVNLRPEAEVQLWRVPVLAQLYASQVRDMLDSLTPATLQYMAIHGVWLTNNPAANGRLNHLVGKFENTDDGQGALDLYMDSRVDDKRIEQLGYNPDIQRELGIVRMVGEPMEQYEMRLQQSQMIFARAKIDAAYLLAQLHYDRGNYSAASGFIRRVLDDPRAEHWYAGAWYMRGRIEQQAGNMQATAEALTHQPSPQEAGNRLRLRYIPREE